jgi:hypothetical protein
VKTLGNQDDKNQILGRLQEINPGSERRWGKMTPHQMLCHLADAFRGALGERPAAPRETLLSRTLVRWVALHTPITWPKDVMTLPEVDQYLGGTKPVEFDADRQAVVDLLRRFASQGGSDERHPMFGALTRREWQVWGFRHVDHHLRQFGR